MKYFIFACSLAACLHSASAQQPAALAQPIDDETMQRWSAPYRGWTYYPQPVIPWDYKIPGAEDFRSYDVPCVYQIAENPGVWYMSFIGFNGQGYNSFVVESADLLRWENPQLAMGFGKEGDFDYGGCVVGAYLYESWDVKAPRTIRKHGDAYWTLYGCYPRQGDYELRPGYEGVAASANGLRWLRASDEPILSVYQKDCKAWEKDCIYQPWLVEHDGLYYNFYNAAQEGIEKIGLALSNDLIHWVRYPFNPVVTTRPDGYDSCFVSDPKVFRDGDHWTMFYFGVGKGGAHIMVAFSRDLVHWRADPEPLYKAGGHPEGVDKEYAHKISLVYNPQNDTFYMFYCAVVGEERAVALLTSKPVR
ncbi:MAG: hypothetical protein LBG47_04020 [Prevotellaceae bacterium]|nr:hypothetical protein [Prevotellaceae bacterium]